MSGLVLKEHTLTSRKINYEKTPHSTIQSRKLHLYPYSPNTFSNPAIPLLENRFIHSYIYNHATHQQHLPPGLRIHRPHPRRSCIPLPPTSTSRFLCHQSLRRRLLLFRIRLLWHGNRVLPGWGLCGRCRGHLFWCW